MFFNPKKKKKLEVGLVGGMATSSFSPKDWYKINFGSFYDNVFDVFFQAWTIYSSIAQYLSRLANLIHYLE
jgi:hypothetical protein